MKNTAPSRAFRDQGFTGAAPPIDLRDIKEFCGCCGRSIDKIAWGKVSSKATPAEVGSGDVAA